MIEPRKMFELGIKNEVIRAQYMKHVTEIANIITREFNMNKEKALSIAHKLLTEYIKYNKKLHFVEHNRKIQRTSGSYSIKITANKLKEVENNLEKLRNMGIKFSEGLVCKLYLPNQKSPVLVLLGKKRVESGNVFWHFKTRKKYYEQYKEQRFTILVESADERIQKIVRIMHHFKRILKKLNKNNETRAKRFEKPASKQETVQVIGVFDSILQSAIQKRKQELERIDSKRRQAPKKTKPAPAPVPKPAQKIVEKVHVEKEQVDKQVYEKLRRKFDEYIDWLTVKRLKEYYNITHIKSFKEYKQAVENNELTNGAEKLIKDISMARSHIRKFIDFLEENNSKIEFENGKFKIDSNAIKSFFSSLEKQMLARDTLSRYKSHLKQFVKFLDDFDSYSLISNYPIDGGRKGNKGQGYLYTPKQIEETLKQIAEHSELTEKEKDELIGLISLMYVTGLRYSEAMRLQVKDFDFENRIAIVRSSKSKKNYARPIFFTEQVRDYLIALIKKYNKKPEDLLFDRDIRFFYQPHKVRITQLLREVGIELNVSGLRDSYATLFEKYSLQTGLDIESLTAGHSAEIRSRHYNQVKTRFEEIFDNREEFEEEYEFVIQLRNEYDRVMKKMLKDSKIPPVQL